MGKTTIECTCVVCGKQFQRVSSEVKRSLRLGRKFYCSLKCSGKESHYHLEPYHKWHPNFTRRNDQYSQFRRHLNCAREKCRRAKGRKRCTLTVKDLKEQWDKQKGICPYTGWQMKDMPNSNLKNQLPKTPDRASLDRIDSSIGYVKGNIQFISLIAQFAKNDFSDTEVINFCKAVANKSMDPAGVEPASVEIN